jgi:hypothetical protein
LRQADGGAIVKEHAAEGGEEPLAGDFAQGGLNAADEDGHQEAEHRRIQAFVKGLLGVTLLGATGHGSGHPLEGQTTGGQEGEDA